MACKKRRFTNFVKIKHANQKHSKMAFVTYQIGRDQNVDDMMTW